MAQFIKANTLMSAVDYPSTCEVKVVRSRKFDLTSPQSDAKGYFAAADNAGKATVDFLTRQRRKLQTEQF